MESIQRTAHPRASKMIRREAVDSHVGGKGGAAFKRRRSRSVQGVRHSPHRKTRERDRCGLLSALSGQRENQKKRRELKPSLSLSPYVEKTLGAFKSV